MISKKWFSYIIGIFVFFAAIITNSAKATEPIFFSGTSHWYELVIKPSEMTWHQCRDSAVSKGGYLVTVGSTEENNFITTLSIPPINAFLGATDELNEGVWIWVTGDTFWNNGNPVAYSNWDINEPNNSNNEEHYLVMIAVGSDLGDWNDGYPNAENMSSFIIEYDNDPCCFDPRGNVNGLGNVTVADLTYLVQYLFNSGLTPPCIDEANVNGMGSITVADLTYLVQYLFNSGPQPSACP